MTVAVARQKGLTVNEAQAKKELGIRDRDRASRSFEQMRLGSTIGGGADTLGYTLMGMAAGGYPADALTDSHIHYLSIYQYPDGAWRTTSYRPPSEYSPFATTAVVFARHSALSICPAAAGVRRAVCPREEMAAFAQSGIRAKSIACS